MLLTEYDERAEREYLRKQSREEGVEEGICVFILDNLEEKVSRERILSKLERRFSLTPEQAEQYFEKYAKAEK